MEIFVVVGLRNRLSYINRNSYKSVVLSTGLNFISNSDDMDRGLIMIANFSYDNQANVLRRFVLCFFCVFLLFN